VAVVGGGISGISATYNLWKLSHGRVRTAMYEAAGSLGGHSVTVRHPEIARHIDIGFQVKGKGKGEVEVKVEVEVKGVGKDWRKNRR
jgi:predicted NAD/FAD-binding protein